MWYDHTVEIAIEIEAPVRFPVFNNLALPILIEMFYIHLVSKGILPMKQTIVPVNSGPVQILSANAPATKSISR